MKLLRWLCLGNLLLIFTVKGMENQEALSLFEDSQASSCADLEEIGGYGSDTDSDILFGSHGQSFEGSSSLDQIDVNVHYVHDPSASNPHRYEGVISVKADSDDL